MGFAWESQWTPLTFTVLRLQALRIDSPEFDPPIVDSVLNVRNEGFQGSFIVNRLLTSSLGLSAGVSGSLVSTDDPTARLTGYFNEVDGTLALSYMHPSGWFASIKDTVVYQDLSGLSNKSYAQEQANLGDPFNLVDLTFGKYFANKRGIVSLQITNVFNQHFNYQITPFAVYTYSALNPSTAYSFYPDREVLLTVVLNF